MQTTHRQFVAASALLAAGRPLPAAEPALRFPTASRDRLAIASYSLHTLIASPRRRAGGNAPAALMHIKDFPAFAVKRFNVRNVEVQGQHLRSTDTAYLEDYRRAQRSGSVSRARWIARAYACISSVRAVPLRALDARPSAWRASRGMGRPRAWW